MSYRTVRGHSKYAGHETYSCRSLTISHHYRIGSTPPYVWIAPDGGNPNLPKQAPLVNPESSPRVLPSPNIDTVNNQIFLT